jgi:ATP-dependent DNA ligase
VAAVKALKVKTCIIDSEVAVLRPDGTSCFAKLSQEALAEPASGI